MGKIEKLVEKLISRIEDRSIPLPEIPWIMYQGWENVLFLSWPIPVERIRPLVPSKMEIDTYEGQAWLSLLPMRMVDLHLRDLPPFPGTSTFPEINLRTYVRVKDQPGIFFFSIDAAAHLGAWTARHLFHLPYLYATMKLRRQANGFHIKSHRAASEIAPAADFVASYQPTGETFLPEPGSLEHFLVERYTLFSESPLGILYQGDSYHPLWELQPVEVKIKTNTILQAAGIELPNTDPLSHYSPGTQSILWPVLPISL